MNRFRKKGAEDPTLSVFRQAPAAGGNRRRDVREDRETEAASGAQEPVVPRGRGPLRAALKLAMALGATALVLWGGAVAYRAATTSDYFAVTEIRIHGNSRLSESDIARAAGIERGQNIFRLDIETIRRNLKREPWVLETSATKKLPRGLEIRVVERKLEALALFDVPYLVDDSGVIFKRWAPGDPMPSPVISGLSREKIADDAEAVQSVIDDAVALARSYRKEGLDRLAPLAEIHAEIGGGFSLTVGTDPFYVRFGKGPYRQKLARFSSLLRRLRADDERPSVVYFDNEIRPDRVTVKMKTFAEKDGADAVALTRPQ